MIGRELSMSLLILSIGIRNETRQLTVTEFREVHLETNCRKSRSRKRLSARNENSPCPPLLQEVSLGDAGSLTTRSAVVAEAQQP